MNIEGNAIRIPVPMDTVFPALGYLYITRVPTVFLIVYSIGKGTPLDCIYINSWVYKGTIGNTSRNGIHIYIDTRILGYL